MSLKHVKWYESAVMRELERQAVKRGHFEPRPEEIVKSASHHVQPKQSFKPTPNLFNDIMLLASGLRAKGLVTQADELESKAVAYKTAETHLYRVHDEDGDDLLDFAYPDGDVEIVPTKNQLGKVWTPQSQQKAIRDVVDKSPTGKLAEIGYAIQITAQESETGPKAPIANPDTYSRIQNQVNAYLNLAKENRDIVAKEPANLAASDKFTPEKISQNKSIADIYRTLGGDVNALAELNSIKSFYRGSETPQGIVDYINNVWANPVNVQKLSAQVARYAPQFATSFQMPSQGGRQVLVSGGVENVANALHQALQTQKKKQLDMLGVANTKLVQMITKLFEPFVNADFSNVEINNQQSALAALAKIENVKKQIQDFYLNNYKNATPYLKAFGVFSDNLVPIKYIFQALNSAKLTIGNVVANVEGAVQNIVQDTQVVVTRFRKAVAIYEKFLASNPDNAAASENLANSNELADLADSVTGQSYNWLYEQIKDVYPELNTWAKFDGMSQQWLTNARADTGIREAAYYGNAFLKQALTRQKSVQTPAPGVGAAKQAPSRPTTGRPTTEERQTVSIMQNMMADMAKGLVEKKDDIATKLNTDAANINNLALRMSDTGGSQTFDGKWGPKTSEGLRAINTLAQMSEANVSIVPDKDYRRDAPETIIDVSRKNSDAIVAVASKIGIRNYMTKAPKKGVALDYISSNLTNETLLSPEDKGDIGITLSDLQSLQSFYSMLEGLSPKISFAAKVGNIIKAAQSAPLVRTNPFGESPNQDFKRITIAEFNQALRWFYNRARKQATTASRPARGEAINEELQARKQQYADAIRKIAQDWDTLVRVLISKGVQSGDPVLKYIDPLAFGVSPGAGLSKEVSVPSESRREPRSSPSEGYSIPGVPDRSLQALKDPPFTHTNGRPKRFLNMRELTDKYGGMDISRYLRTTNITRDVWSSNIDTIVNKYAPESAQIAMGKRSVSAQEWRGVFADLPPGSQEWMRSAPKRPLPPSIWVGHIAQMLSNQFTTIQNGWESEIDNIDSSDERLTSNVERLREYNDREATRWIRHMAQAIDYTKR